VNPYQQAHQVVGLVHQSLVRWTRELLIKAGAESVSVFDRLTSEQSAGPHLALLPYRLSPWPKLIEVASDVSLLGSGQDRDPRGVVPDSWMKLGAALTEALPQLYPTSPAKGTRRARASPLTPLQRLPPLLQAWYEEQGETEATDSWVVSVDGVPHGRLPSLNWRRPLIIRTHYLVLASDSTVRSASGEGAPFGLSALGVITLGMQLERTLRVRLPGSTVDPALRDFALAAAASVGGELGTHIEQQISRADGERDLLVSIVPVADLDSEDFAQVMRSMDQPFQPVVHFAVQMGIGGGPVLTTGTSPSFPLGSPNR